MIILYHGGGAGLTEVLGQAMPDDEWHRIKSAASKLASARGALRASELLDLYPFELKEGTNYFGDEFFVLYAKVPLEQYAELGEKQSNQDDSRALRTLAETFTELGPYVRFITVELDTNERVIPVTAPSPRVTSETVDRALRDAEQLIRTRGAPSAVDRVHTALHGYLRAMLERRGIELPQDASITRLYTLLRESSEVSGNLEHRAEDIQRILRSMSSVVDSLNTLRNRASGAHPNDQVLEEPEAMLAINATRTLLHYLDQKFES